MQIGFRGQTLWLAGLLAALVFGPPAAAWAQGAVDPDHGIVAVGRLLRGLGGVKRVLVIGAHPDDEDTSLLTWLERGLGAEAAYLSLNRGEGGQNLIGPELGVGLGLVRTGELLAARRLDGAEQFFTRAYDFGYSKSADETFRFWPRDTVLADVIAVVRRFRPQIIVSVFSGTTRDGHGQHQVAGILAREAFAAAGDPERFPGQLERGLRPWSPLKLYRSTRFDRDATTLRIETGEFDLLYGRSYHQIAMAGRSQHRSQDMGRIESLGPQQTLLQLIESRGGTGPEEESLFDGVDTTLVGLLSGDLRGAAQRLPALVDRYLEKVDLARVASLDFRDTGEQVSQLGEALSLARRAIELAEEVGNPAAELRFALANQVEKLEAAMLEAGGVVIDAFADDDLVVPGQTVGVEVQIWNGGRRAVDVLAVRLDSPAGQFEGSEGSLSPGSLTRRRFRVTIPDGARPTRPYFLRTPRSEGLYDWPADPSERGMPGSDPVLAATVELELAGGIVERRVEVVHRYADQARGEVRRPVFVVPALSVDIEPAITALPLDRGTGIGFVATIRSESPEPLSGRLRLEVPAGWVVTPAEASFSLSGPGTVGTVEFQVAAPAGLSPGAYTFSAVAAVAGRGSYRQGFAAIDYPHIRRQILLAEARARVEAFELSVNRDRRVGYVPGAGDAVAAAIAAMAVPVEILDERALASRDLSQYDVIVLGIRTYETNAALAPNNKRLLDWVRAGGTLVSQYQQYGYFNENYAPYKMKARFPHDRVSDERAAVTILRPDHPLFNRPNRIGPDDFAGWVQERGLYFANEWDERYEALIEAADPGEPAKSGGLLVTQFGDGLYVYTGLSLFRQLPAGVPGAYRLLANLLSLKNED